MEDWLTDFSNKTYDKLEPYLTKLGFKLYDNEFSEFGYTYDNLKVYKMSITTDVNHLCKAIFSKKYDIYFMFYDHYVYPFAVNSLSIKHLFSCANVYIIDKHRNHSIFETEEDIDNAIKYINLYLNDESKAEIFNNELKNNNKKYYELRSRDKETGAYIQSEI